MASLKTRFLDSGLSRSFLFGGLLTLLSGATATMVAAQALAVDGLVLDSASREPIGGAVITVLDSAGEPSRHTLSAVDGRFRIVRSPTGERLRVRRIGFRPREFRLPAAATRDTTILVIALVRLPQVLAAVRVTGSSLCPGATGRGDASLLWEQARDGLLAAIVAREAIPADAEVLSYERTVAPDDGRVVRHRQRVRTGRTTRAFRATGSAAAFAERGYVQQDAEGRTFSAPDADVLLDETFAATHCFRVVSGGTARPDQIGLAFEPARRRRNIVDVEGVLWLDRTEPAVRELEFRYTGLDRPSTAAGAGGTVGFETMANRVVLITRWSLRMPVIAERRLSSVQARSGPPRSAGDWMAPSEGREHRVVEIRESGGLVLAAAWADGVRWTQPMGQLVGTVVEQGSRRPIARALVTLGGAADTVATDSTGRFVLPHVLPGRYELIASDTTFAAYDGREAAVRQAVDMRPGGAPEVTLELTSAEARVRRLCATTPMRPGSAIILGTVRQAGGGHLDGVAVRAAWQDDFAVSRGSAGARMAIVESERTVVPGSGGRFHVCGVARERPVWFAVRRDGQPAGDTAVFVYDTLVQRVDLVIRPPNRPDERDRTNRSDPGVGATPSAHVRRGGAAPTSRRADQR